MSKIAHLTSVHPPFDPRIFHKECRSAVEAGQDVVLIVPHERDETVDGVRLHAIPKRRGRRARMTRTPWQVYRAALEENADLYHFHDPELIPVGLLLKLRGKRVLYDVHEDMPLNIRGKEWIAPRLRSAAAFGANAMEAIAGRVLDGIVAATPPIGRRFPRKKTVVVQNYARTEDFPLVASQPYQDRPPVVTYIGVIHAARGAHEMVRAVAATPESLGVRLALAGNFSPASLEPDLEQTPGWDRVNYLGWLSRSQIGEALGRSRAGLVVLHPTRSYLESQPTKLYEYMLAGLPVIASDFPLWRSIVDGAGCGLLVDPLDPQAIAGAVHWLLEHPQEAELMGKRGQEAARANYTWESEAKALLAFYQERLHRSSAAASLTVDARVVSVPRENC